jgi:hypothetical protein
MIEFLTLIVLMCEQPGVGQGSNYIPASTQLRQEAFAAKSACIKRIYNACKANVSTNCVVDNL